MLQKYSIRIWAEFNPVISESSDGFCQICNETSSIKIGEFYNQLILYYKGPQIFQKSKKHLKILGATIQNFVAWATWRQGFVHPSFISYSRLCSVVFFSWLRALQTVSEGVSIYSNEN